MSPGFRTFIAALLAIISIGFGGFGVLLLAAGTWITCLIFFAAAAVTAWAAFAVAPSGRGMPRRPAPH